ESESEFESESDSALVRVAVRWGALELHARAKAAAATARTCAFMRRRNCTRRTAGCAPRWWNRPAARDEPAGATANLPLGRNRRREDPWSASSAWLGRRCDRIVARRLADSFFASGRDQTRRSDP